eukprot:SAG22_NODE_643_length_8222_cov_5.448972_2_plen_135_part_00
MTKPLQSVSRAEPLTGGISRIIAKIPIMSGPGSIIFHEPQNALHKSLIQTSDIKFIKVRITDDRIFNIYFFFILLEVSLVGIHRMLRRGALKKILQDAPEPRHTLIRTKLQCTRKGGPRTGLWSTEVQTLPTRQ